MGTQLHTEPSHYFSREKTALAKTSSISACSDHKGELLEDCRSDSSNVDSSTTFTHLSKMCASGKYDRSRSDSFKSILLDLQYESAVLTAATTAECVSVTPLGSPVVPASVASPKWTHCVYWLRRKPPKHTYLSHLVNHVSLVPKSCIRFTTSSQPLRRQVLLNVLIPIEIPLE